MDFHGLAVPFWQFHSEFYWGTANRLQTIRAALEKFSWIKLDKKVKYMNY